MSSKIGDILLRAKLVDDLQLRSALAHQAQWGGRLAHIVVEKRFAKASSVVDAISAAMRLPKIDLNTVTKDAVALSKLDEHYAREAAVFPCQVKDNGKTLVIAMADPSDLPLVDELGMKTRLRIVTGVASETDILAAIDRHYLGRDPSLPGPKAFGSISSNSQELGDDDEEDDGKVVDMAGHTIIKKLSDIRPPTAPAPAPAPAKAPAPSAAANILDDLLGPGAPTASWSAADLARLRLLKDQQDKSGMILRTVLELCLERGVISAEEYKARLGKG